MATYPLSTLAPTIADSGISAPSYNDILSSLQASMRLIFGEDIYLEPDSQDGQLVAALAQAIYDCDQSVISADRNFSPQTAFGAALSNMVKINHLQRGIATKSTAVARLEGVAGTTVNAGIIADSNGDHQWDLPASVVIPPAGFIEVTATCRDLGAVQAAIGTLTKIMTPTAGWQIVSNPSEATPGQPVESDAELRARQVISPAINSMTVFNGIVSSVANLTGVTEVKGYENDTNLTNADGLPPHSVSLVVAGGDINQIAQTIQNKKGVGVATYGTTSVGFLDALGVLRTINFYVPTPKLINVEVRLKALDGYVSTTGDLIKQACYDFVNALGIGSDVLITRLYTPALLMGAPLNLTYEVLTVKASINPAAVGTTDLVIAFNERPYTELVNISVVIVP